ncbi:MAG: AraC family transcriptional regulator [Pseudorhodoplanes sp.]|jgi:AraC-like DNA-binding protein|nr:AraC family transcriptional regulator [Pseudorhodoplanes sp.]
MQKLAYSTDDLPPDYDEPARLAHWQDFAAAVYGSLDCTKSPDRPFSLNMSFEFLGNVGLGSVSSTLTRASRPRDPRADDNFALLIAGGSEPTLCWDGPQEFTLTPGSAMLFEGRSCNGGETRGDLIFTSLTFPKRALLELVPDALDRMSHGVPADLPAMRHLCGYLDLLQDSDGLGQSPQLRSFAGTAIVDLVALALGADRDAAVVASMRGVRGARLHELLNLMQARFCDPSFSAAAAASKLGVTPRSVQLLLEESGSTFSERVLELRLQKARAMLADQRCDRLKIGEIALACGFADATYFNRCFRRRFGTTPTQYRGSAV